MKRSIRFLSLALIAIPMMVLAPAGCTSIKRSLISGQFEKWLTIAVPEGAPRARILAALCAMLPRVGVADDGAFVCDLRGTERLLGTPLRVARNAIHSFACRYNGVEVFRATLGTGIAANPYLRFFTRALDSGELELWWLDDDEVEGTARAKIVVL